MKSRNSPKFIAVIVGVVILCGGILVASTRVQTGAPHDTGSPMFTFSNPAAVYCTDLGYTYENIEDGSGGIQGMCVFPDHTRCDAWDFLAGKCAQHYSYCSQQGYHVRTAKDAAGGFAQEVAICTDSEGQDIGSVDELTQLTTKVYACGAPDEATSRSGQALVHEPDPSNRQTVSDQADGIPPSGWDWRNATYHSVTGDWTTPVKDQGGCGSCWAFAAVGISEAALNLAANNPALDPDLSEEYLVSDCHMLSGYQTCCGGWSEDALLFIRDTGIPDEACMTYVDGLDSGCGCDYGCNIYGPNACAYHSAGQCSDRTCSNRCSDWDSRLVRINQTGYAGSDRTTIQDTLVAYGPLSVSIRASNWFWDGDVLRCSLDAPTNHAVIVLGYQDTPGVGSGGYWIVKNSWGSTWNGDGYVKIGYGECSIEGNVFYASALGLSGLTPSPILPSGTISTATPTFKWSSSVGATSYKLAVWSESAQAYLIQNSVPSSSCDISECSYPSPINLSNGSYRFKVLAITPVGTTPYSDWLAFTITGVTIPPPATPPALIAPNTTVDTHRPTFQWNAVTDATFYRLAVYSYTTFTYVVVENVYPSCVAGVCSYTPYTWDLVNGSYGFKMRSRNSSGYTDYGTMMKFSVSSNLPVAPTLIAPTGTVGANPPAFQWSEVSGATQYRLLVYSIASGSYVIDTYVLSTACSSGVCTHTPASALASGGYKFKMNATNPYGTSGYSAFKSFSVP